MGSIEERRKLLEQILSLIGIHGDTLDWDYLRRRAEEEGLASALAEIERMPSQPGKSRWQLGLEPGKIEKLGLRRYRYHIDFPTDN